MIAEREVLRALAAQGWAVVRPSQDSHVIVRAPNDPRAFSPRIYSRLIEGGYGRLLVNAAPDYRERGGK